MDFRSINMIGEMRSHFKNQFKLRKYENAFGVATTRAPIQITAQCGISTEPAR